VCYIVYIFFSWVKIWIENRLKRETAFLVTIFKKYTIFVDLTEI